MIFGQKSKLWSKIEMLIKHRNFGQTFKFWSKIEILVENRNFGQQNVIFVKNLKNHIFTRQTISNSADRNYV